MKRDLSVDERGVSIDLEFFRNERSGKVHVELPDHLIHSSGGGFEDVESAAVWGLLPTVISLCGVSMLNSFAGGSATRLTVFNDEDLCASCVGLLPDPSKAFEHPQEGEADEAL